MVAPAEPSAQPTTSLRSRSTTSQLHPPGGAHDQSYWLDQAAGSATAGEKGEAESVGRRRNRQVAEVVAVNPPPPALDEPLSPELVLVLPAELRAEAIASLGPPVWPQPKPKPQPRAVEAPVWQPPPLRVVEAAAPSRESFLRSVAVVLAARTVQLGLIFVAVTALTLALSLVAQAFR